VRVPRAFVEAELAEGAEIALDDRAAHHVVRVLRRRRGDALELFDGLGRRADAEIVEAHRRHGCRVRVRGVAERSVESPLRIELVQAMAKGEKMDWIVQKATELGVATIRPVVSDRSDVRPDGAERRLSRWRDIAIGACEQSGRNVLPRIEAPVALAELSVDARTRRVLSPTARRGLAESSLAGDAVCIAVGPEGGFADGELDSLASSGFEEVALGPRVLRTETAAVAAVALLQARFGDLAAPPAGG
jgi:16S rRNA (uracil1498-N3)-methyltransferase